jgi:membrane protein implicated in regulation of membrane protease activity
VVFSIVSVVLLFVVRPSIVERLHAGPTLMTGHDVLIGHSAVVVEPVDARNGRIQLAGELWSARSLTDGPLYDTGAEVIVTRIDGATAVVTTKES